MKRKNRWICALISAALWLCAASAGAAERVEPLPFQMDLSKGLNGSFEVQIANMERFDRDGELQLALYVEDRYAPEQIEALSPGDTVIANGKEYSVELVVIHGLYDKDGDGETDGYDITVKDADRYRDLLEKHKLQLSPLEIIPTSYEIYSPELGESYLAFQKEEDWYTALMDDWVPITPFTQTVVPLPLSDSFVYFDYPGGDDPDRGNGEDFLNALRESTPAFFSPYNTRAVFSDGTLTEIHSWSYPWGPD